MGLLDPLEIDVLPAQVDDLAAATSGQQQQLNRRRRVRIACPLRRGVERRSQQRDFGFGQEAFDSPYRRFLTPRAGLSEQRPRSIAKEKIVLTSVTHCAATPLPPLAMLPDGRFSPTSIF
jgi:hypothetical protein